MPFGLDPTGIINGPPPMIPDEDHRPKPIPPSRVLILPCPPHLKARVIYKPILMTPTALLPPLLRHLLESALTFDVKIHRDTNSSNVALCLILLEIQKRLPDNWKDISKFRFWTRYRTRRGVDMWKRQELLEVWPYVPLQARSNMDDSLRVEILMTSAEGPIPPDPDSTEIEEWFKLARWDHPIDFWKRKAALEEYTQLLEFEMMAARTERNPKGLVVHEDRKTIEDPDSPTNSPNLFARKIDIPHSQVMRQIQVLQDIMKKMDPISNKDKRKRSKRKKKDTRAFGWFPVPIFNIGGLGETYREKYGTNTHR